MIILTRKEEILYAALDLASEHGMKAVTLSQIADRVGIKKPSLYNHFASKDELMNSMYHFIREQAGRNAAPLPDIGKTDADAEEILLESFRSYYAFVTQEDMLKFFRVLYSERSTSAAAARIMLEESERMIHSVKSLFYALVVHGRMKNDDVDTAALSYAMTIHAMTDRYIDMMTAGVDADVLPEAERYIRWFCAKMR